MKSPIAPRSLVLISCLLGATPGVWADPAPQYAYSINSGHVPGGLFPISVGAGSTGNIYVSTLWYVDTLSSSGGFVTRWGAQGTGPGQFAYAGPIAFDRLGNVYVADSYNDRIEKFDQNGNFLAKWGSYGTAPGQFDYPAGLAVSSSDFVYVSDSNNNRIEIFSTSGQFVGQFGQAGSDPGTFSGPGVVALDSSNNVYVTDAPGGTFDNYRVQKFDATGAFLTQWPSYGTNLANSIEVAGIATDPANNVYVADGSNNRIQKFASDGTFLAEWGNPGTGAGQFNTPMGIAVDPSGNYVYVADYYNARVNVFAYSALAPILYQSPTNQTVPAGIDLPINVGVFGAQPLNYQWQFNGADLPGATGASLILSNVPLSASGIYSVSVTNSLGAVVSSNATLTVLPVVVDTLPASSISATGAVLNGAATLGANPSSVWFEWGADTNYGNIGGLTNLAANTNAALSQRLTGLTPDVVYHYRLVGSNGLGLAYGTDALFQLGLAPSIVTLQVSPVSSQSVLLNARVNPEARPTSVFFRWGPGNPYTYYTPTNPIGSGVDPVLIQAQVSGLMGGRIYQFEAVASNALGTTNAAIVSFVAPPWTLLPVPPERVWSALVSSADGSRLAALDSDNQVYLSSDSGLSWTSNPVLSQPSQAVAMSADGRRLIVAGGSVGPAYFSSDYGNTWSKAATPDRNWLALAVSADGSIVFGADAAGQRMLRSTDGGLNWTTNSPPFAAKWSALAASADGTQVILAAGGALNATNGPVFTSADAGQSWRSNDLPVDFWKAVGSSANGQTLAAAVGGTHQGPIYVSTNAGLSWAQSSAPISAWQSVGVSADGTKLAAIGFVQATPLFLSSDSGLTWQPQVIPAAEWISIVGSADGARLYAVGDQNILTLQMPAAPRLHVGSVAGQLAVSWVVPSQPFAAQQTYELFPPQWTNLVAAPALVLTNLSYQIGIPGEAPRAFYRLIGQ